KEGRPKFLIDDLYVKKDGGYYLGESYTYKQDLVNVLMYSLKTMRYEIIRATYDKKEDYYFVDMGRLKSFIHEHGKPELKSIRGEQRRNFNDFYALRPKSLLRMYGYNVSEDEGLTDRQRREILAEVMDLGWCKQKDVIKLLNFLISSHVSDKYYVARSKWKDDLNFVYDYKVNPYRFVMAKSHVREIIW
ncbi:MAG: hypothetical protein HUJ63_06220, partial [Enterococcus sp.]|nr:hypothetical protein [Enterococcus sp.]